MQKIMKKVLVWSVNVRMGSFLDLNLGAINKQIYQKMAHIFLEE